MVTVAAVAEPSPYPALFAFTEADAEGFFGREAEVEALWEKIRELLRGVNEIAETGDADWVVSVARQWCTRSAEALLVADQLEELFTQNAKETAERFATLLGRIATEADVHVVLSLRDDSLFGCSDHARLRPVFEDLQSPTGWRLEPGPFPG